ncbi:MAG: protein kinase [Victivallales bacterium]|nr:protein kinase [Victivallales bacterium]
MQDDNGQIVNDAVHDDGKRERTVVMGDEPIASHVVNIRPGMLIAGKYEVLELLGQGGMGAVYRCLDTAGGIQVALKTVPLLLSHSPAEMEDLKNNYHLVSKLIHQNIAAYRALVQDNATGAYFLVMELVEGVELKQWMKKKWDAGELTFDEVLAVLRQVAAALDYAHGLKIMHRDIKPGNIMVMSNGMVKVLDFGLAANIRSSMSYISGEFNEQSGTCLYMAPEQWQGIHQGAATDQYALAVTAYEMLAGHRPFENDDIKSLYQLVMTQRVPPLPRMPRFVNAALARGLAKDRNERFATCDEFVRALSGEKLARLKTISKGTKRLLLIASLVLLLCLILAGGFWRISRQQRGQGPSVASADISKNTASTEASDGSANVEQKPVEAETLPAEKTVVAQKASAENTVPAETSSAENSAKATPATAAASGEQNDAISAASGEQNDAISAASGEQNAAISAASGEQNAATAVVAGGKNAETMAATGEKSVSHGQNGNTQGSGRVTATENTKPKLPLVPANDRREARKKLLAKETVYMVVNLETGKLRCTFKPPKLEDDQCRTNELWLRRIPKGKCVLGRSWDIKRQREVTLSKDYYIGIFEVTQSQWMNVMGDNPSFFKGNHLRPVERVSYNDICEGEECFLKRLNVMSGLEFDLPTEAQWEYACRGGRDADKDKQEKLIFNQSQDNELFSEELDKIAWYFGNADEGYKPNEGRPLLDIPSRKNRRAEWSGTHPVGMKRANRWYLYDMYGNVSEWCKDFFADDLGTISVKDPIRLDGGDNGLRAVRGSCYPYSAKFAHPFTRGPHASGEKSFLNGFRLICIP